MHEDDEEADMRTQEELMMQHRYMMVSLKDKALILQMRMVHCQSIDAWIHSSIYHLEWSASLAGHDMGEQTCVPCEQAPNVSADKI